VQAAVQAADVVAERVAVEEDLAVVERQAVEEDLAVVGRQAADAVLVVLVVAVQAADSIGMSPLYRRWLRSR